MAGGLLIVVVYQTAWEMTRRNVCAALAAAIITFGPHSVFYSQDARAYGLVQLLAATHLLLTRRLWLSPSFGRRLLCGALAYYLFLLHYTSALQLASLVVAYWIGVLVLGKRSWRYRPVSWLIDHAVVGLVCSLQLPQLWSIALQRDQWASFVDPVSLVQLPLVIPVISLVATAALVSVVGCRFRRAQMTRASAASWCILMAGFVVPITLAVLLTNLGLAPIFHVRYVIVAIVPGALLVALLLRRIRPMGAHWLGLAAVIGMAVATFEWDFDAATNRSQDWRAAIAQVDGSIQPKTVFLRSGFIEADRVRTDSRVVAFALSPVMSIYPIHQKRLIPLPTTESGKLSAAEFEALRAEGAAWFIVCGTPESVREFQQELNATLLQHGVSGKLEQFPYGDVTVMLCRLSAAARP